MSVQYKVKKVNNMKYVIKKSMHYKKCTGGCKNIFFSL